MNDISQRDVGLAISELLNAVRPKLTGTYKNGEAKPYHNISEEFIPLAHHIFMHLYKNPDIITWSAVEVFGDSLCNPFFWRYTDLVHSFCDYLESRNKEVANACS